MEYKDDLWQELPEKVSPEKLPEGGGKTRLRQCFIPPCKHASPNKLHILEKTIKHEDLANIPVLIERSIYQIYCNACDHHFFLILERQFDKEMLAERNNSTEYLRGMNPVRVYAADEKNNILEEIGWFRDFD
nr:hypothetical protein [Candidatus Sigynarchaeota archaeon]